MRNPKERIPQLEAKSTLLFKLITDVLLPKINNSGAIVKDNNAFSRDTQIVSDIARSRVTVVPKSISYRPQPGCTINLLIAECKAIREALKANSENILIVPPIIPMIDPNPRISGVFSKFNEKYDGFMGMVRYIRGFRSGNEYNREVEWAAEVCWDLFVKSTLDRHEEFILCCS